MDEPTIDCWCGCDGAVELQLQSLDDTANWRTFHRCVRCLEHGLQALNTVLEVPSAAERVVVIPLG